MKGGVIHLSNIEQIPMMNLPLIGQIRTPYERYERDYTFMNRAFIDGEWMKQQMIYIDQLNEKQKHIVRSYTTYSDKLVNRHLRGMLTVTQLHRILESIRNTDHDPFFYLRQDDPGRDEIEYLEQFIILFKDIITHSPRVSKPILLFRGIKEDTYINNLSQHNINGNIYMEHLDFISTSFYLPSAMNFIQYEGDCCLIEMYLYPEVPCLLTGHLSRYRGEYEITIIPNTYIKIHYKKNKLIMDEEHYYVHGTDVFHHPSHYGISQSIRVITTSVLPDPIF